MYLEYHKQTKQVVEIHETEPVATSNYDYAISDSYIVGDEFEWTIWINEVDEDKNVVSYSAIRNNPNAKRLLQENTDLKQNSQTALLALADMYESKEVTDLNVQVTLLALAELYSLIESIKGE